MVGSSPTTRRRKRMRSRYRATTQSTADHIPGSTPVLAYHDYFNEYRAHPEHKALGPDGAPCHAWTRGHLQPPVVTATRIDRIGKETIIGADDDPDPSEPISPEIKHAEPACPICGEPLLGERQYYTDRCRKASSRAN
jgi:hypothetical protein